MSPETASTPQGIPAERISEPGAVEGIPEQAGPEAIERLLSVFQPPLATDVRLPVFIALGGYKESGKDALADWLVEKHGFVKVGISEPVHEALVRFDPIVHLRGTPADLLKALSLGNDHTHMLYSHIVEKLGYDQAKRVPGVRAALQKMGTDVGRWLDEDLWVRKAAEKISRLRAEGTPVVQTRVQYANELAMVRELGGNDVWIERPGKTGGGHSSETSLSKEEFRSVVVNDRDLASLRRKADLLVEQLR